MQTDTIDIDTATDIDTIDIDTIDDAMDTYASDDIDCIDATDATDAIEAIYSVGCGCGSIDRLTIDAERYLLRVAL